MTVRIIGDTIEVNGVTAAFVRADLAPAEEAYLRASLDNLEWLQSGDVMGLEGDQWERLDNATSQAKDTADAIGRLAAKLAEFDWAEHDEDFSEEALGLSQSVDGINEQLAAILAKFEEL